MAFACTCDRCGKVMKPVNKMIKRAYIHNYSYSSNTYNPQGSIFYDLCEDCCSALKGWMKINKEENKNG